ncbi:hypothetical protein PPL_07503 [Heterostelium album PN500]|uniref:Uncharacterized protein n=1 Tax=Heterostelium pallidum (strain ATCC 26659 / Pp 5 / PN500) TaxID=670386 RepID=D3BG52_HETP5|nr:hypothetical protein PPL_07503 [Heterostelium album PN500]EFA79644.1 hypothetical protein PPL_07503 [Heterostelium album PN500]|eukprot:XP_020431765.1 hypothetical protein PPL_07503 [Heterostelium album PN500]
MHLISHSLDSSIQKNSGRVFKCLTTLLNATIALTLAKQQYINVRTFQYDINCNGSGSLSDSYEACAPSLFIGEAFYKVGVCVSFNGLPTIFTIQNTEGVFIIDTTYQDFTCKIPLQYPSVVPQEECINICSANPTVVSIVDEIVKSPANSYTEVSYAGSCNGNWKSNFNAIEYTLTNTCVNNPDGSTFTKCNSTDIVSKVTTFYECHLWEGTADSQTGADCGTEGGFNTFRFCGNQ